MQNSIEGLPFTRTETELDSTQYLIHLSHLPLNPILPCRALRRSERLLLDLRHASSGLLESPISSSSSSRFIKVDFWVFYFQKFGYVDDLIDFYCKCSS